ncbi:hypothetical protein BH10PSE18_BH10PSE18_45580 [soil metagenome]
MSIRHIVRRTAPLALIFSLIAFLAWNAYAEVNRVTFPANLDKLVHYSTVRRGNVTEHMLTSQAAIDTVKKGKAVPSGTHVVLVDYRDSEVFRYFVMEKRDGWSADFEPGRATGDWQFQAFKPDRTVNLSENSARCMSCHQAQKDKQFLFTFNDLRGAK